MDDRLRIFEKSTKNLSDIDNIIHRIIDDYNPQTKTKYVDKKRVLSILSAVKNFIIDFYLNGKTIKLLKAD